jgi:hypothetical protein
LDSTTVAFASGKAAKTVAPRMPPLDGCHWSLVIGHSSLVLRHWSFVFGTTTNLTSDDWRHVVSTQSNERSEDIASLD